MDAAAAQRRTVSGDGRRGVPEDSNVQVPQPFARSTPFIGTSPSRHEPRSARKQPFSRGVPANWRSV